MSDYERIARVIRYLDEHQAEQPSLAVLAQAAGLSEAHFHRLFRTWAGVTPKDFLQCLTAEFAKARLRTSRSVLDAALESGLSGPGRLHDLTVSLEAATPGEIKSGGAGMRIQYGTACSPFGACFLGWTDRGICALTFGEMTGAHDLRQEWPAARLVENNPAAAALADQIFSPSTGRELRAYVRGTEFQLKVWRGLLKLPFGSTVTYGQLASNIGHPKAVRAVGSACGANLAAYVIPCHRVIRETALVHGYRWGPDRKRAMLAWEAARIGVRPSPDAATPD